MDISEIVMIAMASLTVVMLIVALLLLQKTYMITRRVQEPPVDPKGAKR